MAVYALFALLLTTTGLLRQVDQIEPQESELTKDASSGKSDDSQPIEVGSIFTDCDGCPAMTVLPPGHFIMGSPAHEVGRYGNEGPVRPVVIGESIAYGVFEVTRGEYRRFVTESGHIVAQGCAILDDQLGRWRFSSSHGWSDVGFEQTDSHPVTCVSWNDARVYTEWLAKQSGKNYRLPSEAEWEYMARGGGKSARYWEVEGISVSQCRFANAADASTSFSWRAQCDDGYEHTSPVGSF